MDAIIVDNFFDNFRFIENKFKEIPLYSLPEYNKKFKKSKMDYEAWPGKRSQALIDHNPFLYNLILKEFFTKFRMGQGTVYCDATVNLRLDKDDKDDWVHKDSGDGTTHTLMIYLSKTNLSSGTVLYDENKQPTTTVGFVQNRAFLFNANLWHRSLNNHGKDIEDGRLTINCFLKM